MQELVIFDGTKVICGECGELLQPNIDCIGSHYENEHQEIYTKRFVPFLNSQDSYINNLRQKRKLLGLNFIRSQIIINDVLPTNRRFVLDFNMPSMVEQFKTSTMNINETIERMCYEGETIGWRCRTCGEVLAHVPIFESLITGLVRFHYENRHPNILVDYTIDGVDVLALEVTNQKTRGVMYDVDPYPSFDQFELEFSKLRGEVGDHYPIYSFGNLKPDVSLIIGSSTDAELAMGLKLSLQNTLYEGKAEYRWIEAQMELARDRFRETEQEINDQFTRLHNNWINEKLEAMSGKKEEHEDERKTRISDNPYDGATLYAELRRQIIGEAGLPSNCTISNDDMVRKLLHTPRIGAELLIDMELKKANQFFPQFNTKEEGWAILKEEIEETQEEMADILKQHQYLWDNIRFPDRFNNLSNNMIEMQRTARQLVEEAVQVAAMVQKYTDLLNRNDKTNE